MGELTFSFAAMQAIELAVTGKSAETGGLLAGQPDFLVEVAAELPNEAPRPGREFALGAEQLDSWLQHFENRGQQLLGTWHSHPGGRAVMSRADAAMAEHTGLALIVGTSPAGWEWSLWDPATGLEAAFRIAPPRTTIAARCPAED